MVGYYRRMLFVETMEYYSALKRSNPAILGVVDEI